MHNHRTTEERTNLVDQMISSCSSEYYNKSFVEPPLSKALHRKDIVLMDITSQINNQQSRSNAMSISDVRETNGDHLLVNAHTCKPAAHSLTSVVLFSQVNH